MANVRVQWDEWQGRYKRDGEDALRNELVREMISGKTPMHDVYNALAWNDHNSDWYLSRKEIDESWTLDGDPITPQMLADSVIAMVEYGM